MKYVSIDIETTGLDRLKCQILEFAAVVEDSANPMPLEQLPTFKIMIAHDGLYWEEVAKEMHYKSGLFEAYSQSKKEFPRLSVFYFHEFLKQNGFEVDKRGRVAISVAGKNFSNFDRVFLETLPGWVELIKINQRVLDPTLAYIDWENDNQPPTLEECKTRAGIINTQVTHRALDDALDVIILLRNCYI